MVSSFSFNASFCASINSALGPVGFGFGLGLISTFLYAKSVSYYTVYYGFSFFSY